MIIGMIISDLEASSKTYRVLDKLRNLGPRMTIVKNSVLIFMLVFMSHMQVELKGCDDIPNYYCAFFKVATGGWTLGTYFVNFMGALALFILALTSEKTQ